MFSRFYHMGSKSIAQRVKIPKVHSCATTSLPLSSLRKQQNEPTARPKRRRWEQIAILQAQSRSCAFLQTTCHIIAKTNDGGTCERVSHIGLEGLPQGFCSTAKQTLHPPPSFFIHFSSYLQRGRHPRQPLDQARTQLGRNSG